jgi:outer membrane protein TolC
MGRMRDVVLAAALLVGTAFSWASAQEGEPQDRRLSLQEALRLALEQNLELRVERYTPQVREAEIGIQEAAFDPTLGLSVLDARTLRPTASELETGFGVEFGEVAEDQWTYGANLTQRFKTGASYELRFDNNRFRTSAAFQLIDPSYGSDLSLTITQPLLRDRGTAVNTAELRMAQTNLAVSRHALEIRITDVAAQVIRAYWELVYARENEKVKRLSMDAAEKLLESNRAKAEAGVLAPIEVLVAEAGAASRREDLVIAEREIRDAEDRLAQLINLAPPVGREPMRFVPTDPPVQMREPLSLQELSDAALKNRPDLLSARLNLQVRDLSALQAENRLLPELSLTAGGGLNGLGGTYSDDLDRLGSRDYYNYQAGLTFAMPLGNRAARSEYRRSRLEKDRAKTDLMLLEQKALAEVRETVRLVESDFKRIETSRDARILAERKLLAEQERLVLGLATSQSVLDFQNDLARARSRELRAVIDYNQSLAALLKAQGLLLQRYRIVFEE